MSSRSRIHSKRRCLLNSWWCNRQRQKTPPDITYLTIQHYGAYISTTTSAVEIKVANSERACPISLDYHWNATVWLIIHGAVNRREKFSPILYLNFTTS